MQQSIPLLWPETGPQVEVQQCTPVNVTFKKNKSLHVNCYHKLQLNNISYGPHVHVCIEHT